MNQSRLSPRKSLGQNFLQDKNVARRIVQVSGLSSDDHVIEIGPGKGILTESILPYVKKLIAVEIDARCVDFLKKQFASCMNLELVHQDFLAMNIEYPEAVRIVGNIPYHLTSAIIFKVFDQRSHVRDLTLLIQKEVADRIAARPCTKSYGILSVLSQTFADVRILFNVPHTVFFPRPKVDSALVQWKFTDHREKKIKNVEFFRSTVRLAFGQRRKMLRNSLQKYFSHLNADSADFSQRPEQLSVEEWISLTNKLYESLKR